MQDQPKAPAIPSAAQPVVRIRPGPVQAPGIVYDSDMGRNIDAALALALLHNLGAKAKLVAVGVSNSSVPSAAFCDAVGRFYAGDTGAMASGIRAVLPVGLAEDGHKLGDSPMLSGVLAKFFHNIKEVIDTGDPAVIYRNALLGLKDGEAIMVLAGPATTLAKMLSLNAGRRTVAVKVGILAVAAGAFPDGPADPRIKADIAAARRLFAEWPSPIVAVGMEVGTALPYPGASIESDFAWAPDHPIVEAYRAYKAMPYDASAQAVAAAFYAANEKEDYFKLSDPGTIEVLDDGRTRFTASPAGKHRYLMVDPAQKESVIKAYTTLASAKPAVPGGRFAVPLPPAAKKQ